MVAKRSYVIRQPKQAQANLLFVMDRIQGHSLYKAIVNGLLWLDLLCADFERDK
jgi:hypothetical protein